MKDFLMYLEDKRKETNNLFKQNKINESQYNMLEKKINEYRDMRQT